MDIEKEKSHELVVQKGTEGTEGKEGGRIRTAIGLCRGLGRVHLAGTHTCGALCSKSEINSDDNLSIQNHKTPM